PLLPFTSQGVSAALEDAVILADLVKALGHRDALPSTLAGFAADRRRDMASFVDGGRRILASFVDERNDIVSPYVDGAESKLEEHLSLPKGNLRMLFGLLDADGDGFLQPAELHQALGLLGVALSIDEERLLTDELDADRDGLVAFDELL